MPQPLTQDQLTQLQQLANQGNVEGYYNKLSSFGYAYGELALGVADKLSLEGRIGQCYLQVVGQQVGVSLDDSTLRQLSVDLVKADIQARNDAGGADLSSGDIERYHQLVFEKYDLPITAWTA
jgi:hypothetical protein